MYQIKLTYFHVIPTYFYEEICVLPIIDKFLWSVVVLTVSPGSDSADALMSWFCDNSPQSVYTLVISRSCVNAADGVPNMAHADKTLNFESIIFHHHC